VTVYEAGGGAPLMRGRAWRGVVSPFAPQQGQYDQGMPLCPSFSNMRAAGTAGLMRVAAWLVRLRCSESVERGAGNPSRMGARS
jgi:hypothetical protein